MPTGNAKVLQLLVSKVWIQPYNISKVEVERMKTFCIAACTIGHEYGLFWGGPKTPSKIEQYLGAILHGPMKKVFEFETSTLDM